MGWTVALLCQSPGNTIWRQPKASTQWYAGTSSYELVRIDCTLVFPTSKSWCHVGSLNWPRWEYLNHRNRQATNQAFSTPKLVVKHLPACCCIIKNLFSNLRQNLLVKLNGYSGTELPFLLSLVTLVSQLRSVHTTSSSVTAGCASLVPTSATITSIAKTAVMNFLAVRWFPFAGSGC